MALIRRIAFYGVTASAKAVAAAVRLRANIRIIAGCAVGFRWIRALARGRITNSRFMTLIRCRTGHRIASSALPTLTSIRLRAFIGIIAACIVRFGGIRALPGRRITYARIMTLIRRRTGHHIATRTRAALAFVRLCTRIRIIAACVIRFGGI